MSVSGVVTSVSPDWRGSALAAATLATDTVLSVVDAADFDEDGGWLVVADVDTPVEYLTVDEGADTVTLAAVIGTAYEADEPVVVWDPTVEGGGARVREDIAEVMLPDAEQPVFAVVKHEQIPTAGVYSLVGATVVLEDEDGDDETSDWYVLSVLGREAQVDGATVAPGTLPSSAISDPENLPSSSGQTFSTNPPPATTTGYDEGHAWWQVVDDEVVGTWRVEGSVWLPVTVVTADALQADNALITALNTVDLSTVNFSAVNIDGGSIYVAQGAASTITEEFSGTSLPAGWTTTKTKYDGTTLTTGVGTAVGSSVVAAGPAGQTGSSVLVDYGTPAGTYGDAYDAAGTVLSTQGTASNGEIKVRYYIQNAAAAANAYLAFNSSGTAYGASWTSFRLSLFPTSTGNHFLDLGNNAFTYVPASGGINPAGGQWVWAHLKVLGGKIYAKVWVDGTPEPAFTIATAAVLLEGRAELAWRSLTSSTNLTAATKVYVDRWESSTFNTGFAVNPDGTGEWPAIGLQAGDSAWRVVGNASQPGFTNGWTEFSTDSVKFRKFPTGDVTINADVTIPAGGHATSIFTLPTTHRPTAAYLNNFAWQNAAVRLSGVSIRTDGTVSWENFGNTGGTRVIFSVTFSTL